MFLGYLTHFRFFMVWGVALLEVGVGGGGKGAQSHLLPVGPSLTHGFLSVRELAF